MGVDLERDATHLKPWEKALKTFITDWKARDDVQAALLVGSFATGNNNAYSDVDIHIILDDDVTWRERGNKIVDGIIIEYFANPPRQILKYFSDDRARCRRTDAIMFSRGKIIFDKTGILNTLIDSSISEMKYEFEPVSQFELETMKYMLFDELQNIESTMTSNDGAADLGYYNLLRISLEYYSRYKRIAIPGMSKVLRWLHDESFFKKYGLPDKLDDSFALKFTSCVKSKDPIVRMNALKDYIGYILAEMGGFTIDGWKLHSDVDA